MTLAADDDGDRPAQVRLAGGERRLGLGPDDPQAAQVQVGQRAGQIVDGSEEQVLRRAGRCLDRRRA